MEKTKKHLIALSIFGLIVAAVVWNCWATADERFIRDCYENIQNGKYDNHPDKLEELMKKGNGDAENVYNLNMFLYKYSNYVDSIYAEQVLPKVYYLGMYQDAETYLKNRNYQNYSADVQILYDHVMAIWQQDPANMMFDEEAEEATHKKYPYEKMKVIYLKNGLLGEADDVKEGENLKGEMIYEYRWYRDGQQVYFAKVYQGYVLDTVDSLDKMYRTEKTTEQLQSGSSKPEKSNGEYTDNFNGSNSSYDDGYDDVYFDEDYDWDRYQTDPDYADGVDDAIDEWEEDDDW